MGLKKGLFFTVDALIAVGVLVVAVIIMSNQLSLSPNTEDINYLAHDTINALSTLQVHELNSSYINALRANGTIIDDDENRSVLELINILWAEGLINQAENFLQTC